MHNFERLSKWHVSMGRKLLLTSCRYSYGGTPVINFQCYNQKYNKHLSRSYHSITAHIPNRMSKKPCKSKSISLQNYYNDVNLLIQRSWIRNFSISNILNNSERSSQNSSKSSEDNENKNNQNEDNNRVKIAIAFIMSCLGLHLAVTLLLGTSRNVEEISWNEFVYHMLAKGEVQRININSFKKEAEIILYPNAVIQGRVIPQGVYYISIPDVQTFQKKLQAAEDSLKIEPDSRVTVVDVAKDYYLSELFFLVYIGVLLLFIGMAKKGTRTPMNMFSNISRARFTLIDPLTSRGTGVRFSDVAGLREAKMEIMEVVDYLKHPDRYKVLGAKVPKGALLLGPPGCGKTMLAKALATEANVPFYSANGSEFIEVFGGLGAARMRDLFATVRKRAPSILFIDEIDAIGGKRLNDVSGTFETEQTLNQLLVEMDGILTTEGVIVLGATNRAEVLDKALLRPGRFDRHISIDLPTLEERKEIFEQHLKSLILEKEPSAYSDKLAHLTPRLSGADIANVCNEAALHAAREMKKKVDVDDLAFAIDRVLVGPEKRDHTMTTNEKEIIAYHESGHALVAWLLEHSDALLKVTIVPRTNQILGFAQYKRKERYLHNKEQLFDKMCALLGGRVAESLTFNKVTTGAKDDLEKVTKMAYSQIQRFGMSPTVGLLSFDEEQTGMRNRKPYSKALAKLMDAEARKMVALAYKRTEELLLENRHKLKLMAETLFVKETLTYDDVVELIGPPPHEKKVVDPGEFHAPLENSPSPAPEKP